MKNNKICFIGPDPDFDGGATLFQKNLISYIKKGKIFYSLNWIYPGKREIRYSKDGINYIELKVLNILFLKDILFNIKVSKFLKKNYFEIINSHGIWGHWMNSYKKKLNQRIVHTYHGVAYYFLKNSSKRLGILKRIVFSPLLLFGYLMEKPPIKRADKIICVSKKVEKELKKLYNFNRNVNVLRTGVDLKYFNQRNKNYLRKKLKFDINKKYGLYIGRGGYWTKGLDRAIELSKEIYKLNKNYKLIIVGADYKKVKHLINEKFVTYFEKIEREKIPYYYNASDIFFCLSRYEGGAPTLVTSEAMASGCLLVCSKDSEQEIIENEKEGVVIDFDSCNYKREAERVIRILNNRNKLKEITNNSLKKIKEFSLEKWGEKYIDILK